MPKSKMFAQTKDLTVEEGKSMSKFDLNEFRYPYKKVKGVYSYLNNLTESDDLSCLFDLLISFLQSCSRPQHIEADINRNIHAFGKEGMFKEDVEALRNWAEALCSYKDKLLIKVERE